MKRSHAQGFTLLEMSVVLVIIAGIIGGMVIAQSMIRNSQLRAITSEVTGYKQAVATFNDKYLALPGDFAGATALWGSADGVVPSDGPCETTASYGTLTCDGNGDGRITTQAAVNTGTQYEQFRVWQHLVDAGLITGSFNGIQGAPGPQAAVIGTNIPASQLHGAGYALFSLTSAEATGAEYSAHYFSGINYKHLLQFGAVSSNANDRSTVSPILTPTEAQLIDSKMDDGNPGTGNVVAEQKNSTYSPKCTTTNNAATALYDLMANPNSINCSLSFLLGF